ncbi:MAG: ABC transporter ATP-binding protein, partial [Candidatus Eisenbacteria bacterium]|nr:ABC transporter ATP-binding protein [Candidatus Latescibacterota bacterium]MBD3301352.1 ABC transporter ATP-binding protein [Candidatus Eisenbacteria bacterium]
MTTEEDIREEERHRHFDTRLWRRILVHARPYRRQMIGLGVSGQLVAGVDVLLPRVTGLTIDTAVAEGAGPTLLRHALEYVGLVAFMSVMIWWFIVLAGQLATGFAYDLRESGFRKLQELSFSFYDRRPVGWLMARLTSDCERVSSILPWFTLDIVWGVALIAGVILSMFLLNAQLALYAVTILPPLAVVSVFFQRKLLKSQREVRKTNSLITAGFNEAIMGVRTSKALVREEENLSDFQNLSTAMYGHSVRNSLQAAVYLPIIITLGSAAVGLSLWQGGVRLGDGMTYGMLVTFMQYAGFLYMPIQELA